MLDGLGRAVTVPAEPRRIVALAPSVTDTLFALGLGPRVVGVTDFCRVPAEAGAVARVGGLLDPNLETIRALRADLVVASSSGNEPSLAERFAALAIPLYTLHTPDVPGTLLSIERLAEAIGEPERGRALAAALRGRLDEVRARVAGRPRPRVLFFVYSDPLVVPGRGSFMTDALERAGALSITSGAPGAWPAFDLEAAIAAAPEAILTNQENRALADRLPHDPAWRPVPAVRAGRIRIVSDAIQQPGPRVIDGIEEVARILHPEAFDGR